MPKKRHWAKYSKPQTTAPNSLESSGLQSSRHHATEERHPRGVNELLASLRRTTLTASAAAASGNVTDSGSSGSLAAGSRPPSLSPAPIVAPSVPPEIAHFLLPGLPGGGTTALGPDPPGPHGRGGGVHAGGGGIGSGRPGAAGAAGGRPRRAPAGPAPPPSWLSQSRHAPRQLSGSDEGFADRNRTAASLPAHKGLDMPGLSPPERGSLVDVVLRRMVADWDTQKHFNQFYLPYLQGSLRAALVSYISGLQGHGKGVSAADLKALLLLPSQSLSPTASPGFHAKIGDGDDTERRFVDDANDYDDDSESDEESLPSPSTLNEDFRYLDLTSSIGRSISIKELNDLLFPGRGAGPAVKVGNGSAKMQSEPTRDDTLLDSWDAPGMISPPRPLLPNLTHISLALTPDDQVPHVSWRQLLAFVAHLPMLTHLSLAYWPEPTLTPNAKFATVVSPQGRRLQYGGTGPYSHSLDNDWAEAVLLVRKLSKALYGLEYLDLTGCAAWFPALMKGVDNGQVDWVGDWGKMTTLILRFGAGESSGQAEESGATEQEQRPGEVARQVNAASEARLIEQHIRQQRAGRGRFITVVRDRPTETR